MQGATVVDRAVNISPVEDELSPSMNSVPREQMFGNDRVRTSPLRLCPLYFDGADI